jgi:hypothetical protein
VKLHRCLPPIVWCRWLLLKPTEGRWLPARPWLLGLHPPPERAGSWLTCQTWLQAWRQPGAMLGPWWGMQLRQRELA